MVLPHDHPPDENAEETAVVVDIVHQRERNLLLD
jgi:hypothetical protein